MLDQNFVIFARLIHEQRVKEALGRQRPWQRPGVRFALPQRWVSGLGERLIALGQKLKAQGATDLSADPFTS
jgi:hypothetical protein